MGSFFSELKRRNVFKVGAAYLALSWLLVQVGSTLVPLFGISPKALLYVVFLLLIGFPLALLFAWAYELTPEGLKKSNDVEVTQSVSTATGQRLNHIIIGILTLALVALLVDRFAPFGSVRQGSKEVAEGAVLGDRSYESIAVLPFVNMSADPAQEFFSDGISEELLNLLAKTQGLRVAARTSSFAFKGKNADVKQIGDQLDVQTVLEGSVRKSKSRLRITAQLIDVDTGFHLWSETYDRELDDVFVIQDEISEAIVNALQVHFGGEVSVAAKSREANVEAYQDYLMGRELLTKRTLGSIETSIDYFTAAIEKDPGFASAYADKAAAYLLSSTTGTYGGTLDDRLAQELALPLIEKAIALAPDLPDGYAVRGFYHYQRGEPEEAVIQFDKALARQPSHSIALMWKALTYIRMQRWRDALMALETAHRIDPLSLVISQNLVNWRIPYGDVEGAAELGERMKEIAPERPDRWGRVARQVAQARRDFSLALSLGRVEAAGRERVLKGTELYIYSELGAYDRALEIADENERLGNLVAAERCAEAREIADKTLNPDEIATGLYPNLIGYCLQCAMDYQRAYDLMLILFERTGAQNDLWASGRIDDTPAAYIHYVYVMSGYPEEAAAVREDAYKVITRARENGLRDLTLALEARFMGTMGDLDGAMDNLEEAFEKKLIGLPELTVPMYLQLRGTPRFEALRAAIHAEVNKERADLGWEPLPDPANAVRAD